MELRRFRADLHIHSCLSPCGELRMSPRRIIEQALQAGLDIVAVSDHNSAENAAAAVRAARGTPIRVFPGMEITSEEEVHILGVFGSISRALRVEETVYRNLPGIPGKTKFTEDQVIADERDIVSGFCPRFLMGATSLSIYQVLDLIHDNGGLAIASHVDRDSFSVISQLGFIPPNLEIDALEVSPNMASSEAQARLGLDPALPVVSFSDAHQPDEIGLRSTAFLLARPTIGEIRKALRGRSQRRVMPS